MGMFRSTSTSRYYSDNPALLSTGYPLTMACWYYPTAIFTRAAMSFGDGGGGGGSGHRLGMGTLNTGSAWLLYASDASLTNSSGGAPALNKWAFMIGRFMTATDRRLDVLQEGTIFSIQGTASRVPSGLNRLEMGATGVAALTSPNMGSLAEFWYMQSGIPGVSGAIPAQLLYQLAYKGPFSVPSVGSKVIEYQSLLKGPFFSEENFFRGPRPNWTYSLATGALTSGIHPPLPARPRLVFAPFK